MKLFCNLIIERPWSIILYSRGHERWCKSDHWTSSARRYMWHFLLLVCDFLL